MLWIIFTLIATIIAVLTYKRAKSTVLQPIRNETIKKQAVLLEEILNFIKLDVDYYELLELNVLQFLIDYGFVLKNQKEIKEMLKNRRCGQRIVSQKENSEFIEEFLKSFPYTNRNFGKPGNRSGGRTKKGNCVWTSGNNEGNGRRPWRGWDCSWRLRWWFAGSWAGL